MNTEALCRDIYRQAFHDPDTVFEDLLFGHCFEYCKVLYRSSLPVSMLFALPCEIAVKSGKIPSVYIYAAATLEKYRGLGLMTELLNNTVSQSDIIFLLRPANERLIDFYNGFGFKAAETDNLSADTPEVLPLGGFKALTRKKEIIPTYNNYTLMYRTEKNAELPQLKFLYSME